MNWGFGKKIDQTDPRFVREAFLGNNALSPDELMVVAGGALAPVDRQWFAEDLTYAKQAAAAGDKKRESYWRQAAYVDATRSWLPKR